MSWLLSQGKHCCDVGILYPVSAVDGGMDGQHSVDTAFALGRELYSHGMDFDFIDRESLVRGTAHTCIVIPDMRSLRADEYAALLDAAEVGKIVLCIGKLPEYSDGDISDIRSQLAQRCVFAENALAWLMANIRRDVLPENTKDYYVQHRKIDGHDVYMTYGSPRASRSPSAWRERQRGSIPGTASCTPSRIQRKRRTA